MHFVKPLWLTHPGELRDFDVYSCHVSPDGNRLVTAAGDGFVRVWSTEAIYKSHDPEYTKPKQLAAISHHSGTIHTVRFSGNGKYLASGADDKIVCVYVLDPNPPTHGSTFGSNEPPPVENWRVLRRLIGHDNDVQDLGWSEDSSILVSVGLDSKIVIWSGHTFEKLKTLSNHQSHVKGITFDPANKYFATASDDRTIKVFRFTSPPPHATAQDQVNNFIQETTIIAPFAASPLTTYFRRCSWSPEGNHIAAANAVNGPVSSVAIISRGSWDSDINLIGHEGPVEVCAFSPRLFYREPLGPQHIDAQGRPTLQSVTVVACAGQDKTLSIWNTSFARPFTVTAEIANKAISDLAWAPDGETLFVTSLDGSIMAVIFEKGELGYPASLSENEKSLSKFGAGRRVGLIESTDALLLEESSKAGEDKAVQGRMGELMGDAGAAAATAGNNGTVPPAKTNGIVPVTNGTAPEAAAAAPPPPPPTDPKVERLKTRVTYVNGKKRIQPMLISSASGLAESSLPQTKLVSAAAQGLRNDAPHSVLDLSKPYDGLPKGGLPAMLFGNKRKFAEIEGDDDRRVEKRIASGVRNGAAPIVINGTDGLTPPNSVSRNDGQDVPSVLRPAILNPAISMSQVRLAIPMVRSTIVRTMDGSDPEKTSDDTIILEARNAAGPSRTGRTQDRDPARINCTRKNQSIWQDYLPRSVLLVTGNLNFWAAACEDGSIYTWTPAGRRLLNAIVLEAQPVIMDCRGWYLMCVTAVGICHVWNIKTQASPHPPVSLAPILDIAVAAQGPHLTTAPGIVFARMNSAGRIIVAMSNGDGYTYSPTMFTWQRLSEAWWAVGSQYWNTTDSSMSNIQNSKDKSKAANDNDEVSIENISAGIIPQLERNTTNHTLLRGRAFYLQRLIKALLSAEGYEGFEASVSIAHLENRVAAALTLGAKEEFKIYLLMYAKRLGAEGLRGKVEELLRTLVGSLLSDEEDDDDSKANAEKDEICGWKREDILKDVVLILGKYRDLQRVTTEYASFLNMMHEKPEGQAMITDS
ncbi:histone transcription regulator HIRA, WD repeat superfamily [Pseudovirgaria hyperparasitica]|uniref:Protein HIR n=1 Tax=Pseudovirgaria hyperparasitica TaxID=470096 RepID=A0A6A6WHN0_9PEZI|nr:histone transcription regulator HIRA, WD repeat superfamily [Pseudovirgaria hyperparasitica]KAF2761739.1 histone transcription regulator HIRA, WD repeat superfamily [Pseudovirgaria hyperparasitica]